MSEKKARLPKLPDGRKMTAVRLSPLLARRVSLYAATHEKSVGQVCAEAIEEWWQERPDRVKYEQLAKSTL
jgi:predicted HicB family RNase H-like nuclease